MGKKLVDKKHWYIYLYHPKEYGFWHWSFLYAPAGYFDSRRRVTFKFLWLKVEFLWGNSGIDECDPGQYGLQYHNETVWLMLGPNTSGSDGSKWKTWHVPWKYDWVRTSKLLKDQTWEHEVKGDRKDFYAEKWEDKLWKEVHPFTYVLKRGRVQNTTATITVSEMEWRQRWLKWTKWKNKVRKTIDIRFADEIGERAGSWKGGVLGTGHEMLPGESPGRTLQRMAIERDL